MDEQKGKDVSVSRGDWRVSTLTVSEHVAGGSETPVGSMAQIGQRSNASRGSSDGGDIMVDVVSSNVFVDGVCGNDGGDKVAGVEILNNEEIRGRGGGSGEAGVERDLRSLSDGYGAVGEISPHENGVWNDEVLNRGIGMVEGSTVDVGSMDGETQVVNAEDDMMAAGEEGMERGSADDDVERGHEVVGGAGEAQDLEPENVVGSSTVASDTLSVENQIVEGEVVRESKKSLENEQVKGAEQGSEMDGGGEGALQDVKAQYLGILDDETLNPGILTVVAGSSAIVEFSSVQTRVVEDAALLVNEQSLNPKVDAPGRNAMEGITSSSEAKQILIAVTDNGGAGNNSVVTADSNPLDVQNPIAVSVEVAEMDKGEFMCSTIEDLPSFCQLTQVVGREDAAMDEKVHLDSENDQRGNAYDVAQVDSSVQQMMEIDEQVTSAKLDGMLSCSGNVQNFKSKTLSIDTELDSQFAGRGDGIPLITNQEALNYNVVVEMSAENDQQLEFEERLDNSGMVVEQEVYEAEQVSSDEGHEIKVQKQPKIVETIGGSTERYRNICSDPISTGQLTHEVVGGEVAAVDDKVPSNPIVEVPQSTDLDGTLSCSGIEAEFTPKESEDVLDSKVEGLGTAEGDKSTAVNLSAVDLTVGQEMEVEEEFIDAEQAALHEGPEMEVEEHDSDTEQPETNEEKFVKRAVTRAVSSVKSHQASYRLPLEYEGEFYVSDLVWGKVRSHPWWPGQIYDPSDASEKAMKYQKKDCFLVAYFGDRTFAWVDASQLKPFYSQFSQVEKQSNSEVFQNAVSCALEEVCRRVELGLACPCITKAAYDEIRLQIVENTGIQQESSVREGVDKSASAQSFQPDKLVEYIKALAQSPSGGADRLDLVIAKAQLLSFYRLKGYCQLPEFQFCGGLVENGVDTSHFADKTHATPVSENDEHIYSGQVTSETQKSSCNKRKHNLKDSMYPRKKERSLSELMSGSLDSLDDDEFESDGKASSKLVSPSSGKKRKAIDFAGDDSSQDGRKTISLAKVSITTHNIPKPSFKIGECIRRVASQMTGSPSILKSNSERLQKLDGDGSDVSLENFEDVEGKRAIFPTEYSSLDDLLSQLHLAARDPMKGYSFFNIIISFFSDFRNSILDRRSADKVGGKRKKPSLSIVGSPETFEFEDMSDTYWTDRVIQNGAEEQPSPPPSMGGRNTRGYQIVPVELKPAQKSRRSYSRKQYSNGNHDVTPQKPPGYVDENSPAELIINFSEVDTIPSETNLNKMFRRFGPLKESGTEIDRETSRARVVFKRCSDAEVAHGSAAKFNVFGPMVVNYQLSYSISEPFKASPMVTSLGEEYAT